MPEAQFIDVDDAERLWLSLSHARPRRLQEDMAIDTDASTSASTEQTDHASLRLASVSGT